VRHLVQHHLVPQAPRVERSGVGGVEAHRGRDGQQAAGAEEVGNGQAQEAALAVHLRQLRPEEEVVYHLRPVGGRDRRARQVARHRAPDARGRF
jgi:hypothetical protein